MALVVSDATEDLTIRAWSPTAERLFGYSRAEMLGQSPYAWLIPPEYQAWVRDLIHVSTNSDEALCSIGQNVTKDRRRIWCEWHVTSLRDDHGKVVQIMATVQDITERCEAEERLRLWASVLEYSAEGICICDAQQRILLVNPAFQQLTGLSAEEAVGKTPRILQSGRQTQGFYAAMWHTIRETGRWHGEIWNRRKNGEMYAEWLSISTVYDKKRQVTHYIGIFSDITARKEADEHLLHLAQYDALTDLPNRVLLLDRLGQLTKAIRREQSKGAVLFIDLDHFKAINDTLGHAAGDLLLQTVAKRLTDSVRSTDTVARMGGDEFIVTLPQLHQVEDAALVAEKLLAAISTPVMLYDQGLSVSASIGMCIFPDDGANAEELIRNADAAMYQAKNAGRNTYQFYTRDMNEPVGKQRS